jgi:hypothetical protein
MLLMIPPGLATMQGMRCIKPLLFLSLAWTLAGCSSLSESALPDTAGMLHRPLETADRAATVLIFILADCPISNAYVPEINRLTADYQKRNVALYVVHVDADASPADLERHAKEYGYACPVLIDGHRALAGQFGITVAPEAALLDSEGKLVYRGRIDDLFAEFGKRRAAATTHELRDAMDSVLAGRPVRNPLTRAVGCSL